MTGGKRAVATLKNFCRNRVRKVDGKSTEVFCASCGCRHSKEKKWSDLRQPQLGKNLENWKKKFELQQPKLEKNEKND